MARKYNWLPSTPTFRFEFRVLFVTVELPMGQKKYSAKWLQIFLNIYMGKIAKEQSFRGVEVLS